MCCPASLIVTKHKVFWSRFSESHEDIIREFNLHMDGARGPNGVRVELSPAQQDFTAPVDEWSFRVDQDTLPDWWDPTEAEERVRKVVEDEWLKSKVLMPGELRCDINNRHLVAVHGEILQACGVRIDTLASEGKIGALEQSSVGKVVGYIDCCYASSIQTITDLGEIGRAVCCRIHSMGSESHAYVICDQSVVSVLYNEAVIECVTDTSLIASVGGTSRIEILRDRSVVAELWESATIGRVCRGSAVLCVRDQAKIERIEPGGLVSEPDDDESADC